MKRRLAVEQARDALGRDVVSERRACRVLGQARSTQRRERYSPDEERGLQAVQAVWALVCTAHNLLKLAKVGLPA